MFSFIDGFNDYNQIKIDSGGAEKTTFSTPMDNFHYKVMPFRMKNTGTTYQRAITAIFHNMIHDCVEDYAMT